MIVEGSVYSCDLKDLAFVHKSVLSDGLVHAIILIYKQGANITIKLGSLAEQERQYKDIIKQWKGQ